MKRLKGVVTTYSHDKPRKLAMFKVTCGRCDHFKIYTSGRDVDMVRNQIKLDGYIYTGRFGWVCPKDRCQRGLKHEGKRAIPVTMAIASEEE